MSERAVERVAWRSPPETVVLQGNEVHVWRACLDQGIPSVQNLRRFLSEDELIRAARFHFDRDRDRFTVGRGLLRLVLSRYADIGPGDLRFRYSQYGKPSLVVGPGTKTPRFSVSHSGGLVVFAVSFGRELGIDLEWVRADFAYEQIAERFFSLRENAVLRALSPETAKRKAFFDCWTRKEAYLKARGEGLSLPLRQCEVSLAPGEPARLLANRSDPREVLRWSIRDLDPAPGFVAALAVEGCGWRLTCWEWP